MVREQAPPDAVQVPGWPAYKATKDGRVFGHKGLLKPKINTRGYPSVCLQENANREGGRVWHVKVARVIAETFIGPANGRLVRHLDDDRLNSNLSNISYGNHSDNAEDARKNGRLCEGVKHGSSKYTEQQIRDVRRLRLQGMTYSAIEQATGVHEQTVGKVVKGFQWRSVA